MILGFCETCYTKKESNWHWAKLDLDDSQGRSKYGRAVQTHICDECMERMSHA